MRFKSPRGPRWREFHCYVTCLLVIYSYGAKHSPSARRLANPRGPRAKYTRRMVIANFDILNLISQGRGERKSALFLTADRSVHVASSADKRRYWSRPMF